MKKLLVSFSTLFRVSAGATGGGCGLAGDAVGVSVPSFGSVLVQRAGHVGHVEPVACFSTLFRVSAGATAACGSLR